MVSKKITIKDILELEKFEWCNPTDDNNKLFKEYWDKTKELRNGLTDFTEKDWWVVAKSFDYHREIDNEKKCLECGINKEPNHCPMWLIYSEAYGWITKDRLPIEEQIKQLKYE